MKRSEIDAVLKAMALVLFREYEDDDERTILEQATPIAFSKFLYGVVKYFEVPVEKVFDLIDACVDLGRLCDEIILLKRDEWVKEGKW